MQKKILTLLLACVMLLGLIPLAFSPSSDAASASSVADARDKIAQAQAKQQELQKQLDALSGQKQAYMAQKEIIEQQVGELAAEIAVYDELIAGLDAEIAVSEKIIADAQAEYNKNIDSFRAQARATYEKGQTTYLEVLLGAESFSEFLLGIDYVKQVSLYEKKLLDTITESIRIEREEMAVVAAKRAENDALRNSVKERKAVVDAKNAELAGIISNLNSNAAALNAAKQDAAKREEELNKWIEKELAKENSYSLLEIIKKRNQSCKLMKK